MPILVYSTIVAMKPIAMQQLSTPTGLMIATVANEVKKILVGEVLLTPDQQKVISQGGELKFLVRDAAHLIVLTKNSCEFLSTSQFSPLFQQCIKSACDRLSLRELPTCTPDFIEKQEKYVYSSPLYKCEVISEAAQLFLNDSHFCEQEEKVKKDLGFMIIQESEPGKDMYNTIFRY